MGSSVSVVIPLRDEFDSAVALLSHRDVEVVTADNRGFAAVLAAMRKATGRWIVVMDGVAQPGDLAVQLARLGESRDVDLVIASRTSEATAKNALAKLVFPHRLGQPVDPTSGFFADTWRQN